MSNFIAPAFHPKYRRYEQAMYLDNFFGPHNYAVRFEDGSIFPLAELPALSMDAFEDPDIYLPPLG